MAKSDPKQAEKSTNQGEGNREAARQYNEAQREFVREGKVEEQAADRSQLTESERRDAERAETEGEARAKEKDPNVVRDYDEGTA